MNSLLAQRLINGMTNLKETIQSNGSPGDLVLKTGNALAVLQSFIMSDDNFTDAQREVIFSHAHSVIRENTPEQPPKPLCKNCGKRWGQHGGEWCTPGDFKGTKYEPIDEIPETMR